MFLLLPVHFVEKQKGNEIVETRAYAPPAILPYLFVLLHLLCAWNLFLRYAHPKSLFILQYETTHQQNERGKKRDLSLDDFYAYAAFCIFEYVRMKMRSLNQL